jgi:hypothetical protein
MSSVWYINTTMILRLESLVDQDGDPIEDATVEMTECVDCDGNTPGELTLPLTLTHTADGNYEATIDADVEVEDGARLTATIVATETGGATREWQETITVRRSKG